VAEERGGSDVVRVAEAHPFVDLVAAFVEEAVVAAAEQDEVVEGGLAASRPVMDVVCVDKPVLAAGEATAAVT
jgi:hypothetical protein